MAEPPRTPTGFLLHETCGADPTVVLVQHDDQPAPRADRPVVLADGLTREQLLAAVREAREGTADALTLEGHGSSGVAVLSLALHQRRLGLELTQVTCSGARGEDDPVSGGALAVPTPTRATTRVTIVAADDEASQDWSAATAAAFRDAGWTVS